MPYILSSFHNFMLFRTYEFLNACLQVCLWINSFASLDNICSCSPCERAASIWLNEGTECFVGQ